MRHDKYLALFDSFLTKTMSAQDEQYFIERLENNVTMRKDFTLYKRTMDMLTEDLLTELKKDE